MARRELVSPPIDALSMRKHAAFRTTANLYPTTRESGAQWGPRLMTRHVASAWIRIMTGCYLVGTQIWPMLPMMVMAVPFVWGRSSASTLLASRLIAANPSIAIVHQIDFMDSSRMQSGLHVSCRIGV